MLGFLLVTKCFTMSRFTVASILLLFLLPMFTTADIRNIKITSDRRHGILFQRFGFTESGHVSISIESPTFNSAVGDPSRLAFFIIPTEDTMSLKWNLDLNSDCLLDRRDEGIRILFNFTQLNNSSSFIQSFPIMRPVVYSLYFANCQPDSGVTMSVTTEMYNLGAFKDYLPSGQTQSDIVYVVFAALYFVFCLVWADNSLEIREKHFWTRMSMGGLILMKALSLICAAVDQHYLKFTGTSHGWDVVFYIFQLSRVFLLCAVIAQIGIRWSILHPRPVQITMMIVLIILLPLQVVADINFTTFLETRLYLKNWTYLLMKYLFFCGGLSFGIWVTIFSWSICLFVLPHRLERTAPKNKVDYYVALVIFTIWWFISSYLLTVWKMIYASKLQTVLNVIEETGALVTYVGTFSTFGHAIHTNAIPVANPVEEGSTLQKYQDRESASNV